MKYPVLICLVLVQGIWSQNVGNQKQEQPLPISVQVCTGPGSCQQESDYIVMDANWRWTHTVQGYTNCYTGNLWDSSYCPDPDSCTNNCAVDGIDTGEWTGTYGITTSGNQLNLKFVTHGPYSTNIGSRTYLLDSSKEKYRMFNLLNKEFTFDVDVSTLDCGLNGALYFVEMAADGGKSKYPSNHGGAKYGTGYCDAQCPHDLKWINGKANCKDWKPSPNDPNSGTGHYGTCCGEMDIWEANSRSQAFTTHPCSVTGQTQCEGKDCGDNITGERYDGVCDKDGCDFASYRLNDHKFFGRGSEFAVDTTQKVTVVTQFVTSDGTDNGKLAEVRRFYVQNGKVIQNSKANFDGLKQFDSITDEFCGASKGLFGDYNDHAELGGLAKMGEAMKRGMVLVMSLWDDHDANMLWLDSNYPPEADPSKPGIARGPCPITSGVPSDVEAQQPDATVRFSNIRFGPIGSTTH